MHAEQATAGQYGAFRCDGMALALPVLALREALPHPQTLPLPCASPHVVGGIELRGAVLPLIDLALVLGRPRPTGSRAHALVIAHGERRLALAVDAIDGIFGVDDDAAAQAGTDPAELYAGAVRRPDQGTMVQRLSPQALLDLPGLPRSRDQTGQDRANRSITTQPVLLLRCGRLKLALDALVVQKTLAGPALQPSVIARAPCRGVIEQDGVRMAAVDLREICGFGPQPPRSKPSPVVVLMLDEGPLGLLVDSVDDVRLVADKQRVPVSSLGLPAPELFEAALALAADDAGADDGSPHLLLSAAALRRHDALRSLASVHGHPDSRKPSTQATDAGRIVSFMMGSEFAVPIGDLQEILRCPEGFNAFGAEALDGGMACGIVVSRGRSIPVLDLQRLAGMTADDDACERRVLVVRRGAMHAGFAVPSLKSIDSVRWAPSADTRRLATTDPRFMALGVTRFVLLGEGAEQRMVPVLDLPALADRLAGGGTTMNAAQPPASPVDQADAAIAA